MSALFCINLLEVERKQVFLDFGPFKTNWSKKGIGLTELTEPPGTLNYKPFFKHFILQTVLHVPLLFMFVWKTELHFAFFWFASGWHSVLHY